MEKSTIPIVHVDYGQWIYIQFKANDVLVAKLHSR